MQTPDSYGQGADPESTHKGRIRAVSTTLCIDIPRLNKLRLNHCHQSRPSAQAWTWKEQDMLHNAWQNVCMEAVENHETDKESITAHLTHLVVPSRCDVNNRGQRWSFSRRGRRTAIGFILHQATNLCLTPDLDSEALTLVRPLTLPPRGL